MTKARFAALLPALLALLLICGCAPEEPATPPKSADVTVWVRRPGRDRSEYYTHDGAEAGALLAALEQSLTPAEGENMLLSGAWYQIVENLPAEPDSRGDTLVGLWCGGLFLAADGALYRSDLDLAALLEPFSVEIRDGSYGPFCHELCRLLGGWQAPLLASGPPAQSIPLPQGRILSQSEAGCTVRLEAPADSTLQYPDAYAWLEVRLDGVWYRAPEIFDPRLYASVSMDLMLLPGQHLDVTFTPAEQSPRYGALLPGQYRWCCFQCQWEFSAD